MPAKSSTPVAPLVPIEFEFQAYDAMEFKAKHPLILFAFEEQPDTVIAARFHEIESMRLGTEQNREVADDMTQFFSLTRDGKDIPAILVYIGQKWRPEKRRKKLSSIDFYRVLGVQMCNAIKKLRDMGHTEATIVLPGRFHPRHLKKDPHGEQEEDIFVRTLVESMVTTNSPDANKASPRPTIAKICFTHFGDHQQTATHFFNRAIGAGLEIGNAVQEARELTKLPPDDKVPLLFAERLCRTNILLRSVSLPDWRTVKNHGYGSSVKAQLIYGVEGLRRAGFGLIAAVGQGSRDEPCFLKLHYRP